jgi:flagellar biosynthesis/type III secretory pathway M-ring protein FliF/YscJ
MVPLALILLVLVAVLVVAILVSNPQTYDLSIFGAVIPVTSAGVFFTGAVAMAVTILALMLLRIGIRRARARRQQVKALEASRGAAAGTASPAETSSTDAPEKSALDLESESGTTAAERQAMLDEAEELTRDEPEPQK